MGKPILTDIVEDDNNIDDNLTVNDTVEEFMPTVENNDLTVDNTVDEDLSFFDEMLDTAQTEENEYIEEQENIEIENLKKGFVPKEEWVQGIIEAFGLASIMTHLQSLDISDEQKYPTAIGFLNICYVKILKIKWLHFAIRPGGDNFQFLLMGGAFISALGKNVSVELKEKAELKKQKQENSEDIQEFDNFYNVENTEVKVA